MNERRQFLMGAGGIAAGLATGVAPVHAATAGGPRYAMLVDLRRCIGCQACTVACSVENGVPAKAWRTVVTVSEVRTARGSGMVMLPRLCNHCDEPACVPPCPKKATYKTADGTVQIDADLCIGCGRCVKACPYGARYIDEETGTADKCSFCVHRVAAGLAPACVETCVGGARIFGDLNDSASAVAKAVAAGEAHTLLPRKGTRPHVFYIGLDETIVAGGRTVLADPRESGA
jgi:tetrathionate reductase subunit B